MTDTRNGDTPSAENEATSRAPEAVGENQARTVRSQRAFAALADFFDSDFARLAGAGFVLSLAAVLVMSLLTLVIGVVDTSSRAAAAIQGATGLATVMVAVSLIAVLMAKVDNVVVRGVGILLIGALIVPTTDLVRFWLLASGSDRNIAEFYPEAESGGTKIGGDGTLALRVLVALEERGVVRDFAEREFDVVRAAIADYDIQQTHEAVVGNGALPLLIAVRDGEVGTWIMRDNADSRFREAMTYLRRQGLITFPYDAYAEAKTTLRGNAVAAFEGYRFPRPDRTVDGLPGGAGGPFELFDTPDTPQEAPRPPGGGAASGWAGWVGLSQPAESAVTPLELTPGAETPQRLTGEIGADDQAWYGFSVGETMLLAVRVDPAEDTPGFDPMVRLYVERPGDGWLPIAEDDDGADGLSSAMRPLLPAARYRLAIRDYSGSAGSFVLRVGAVPFAGAQAAPRPGAAPGGAAPAPAQTGAAGEEG